MHYQYISHIWLLILSGIITLSLGVYTLIKCRNAKGAFSFAIAMFVVTLWSIPNALEMSSTVLYVKLLWANIQYIAYCFSPVILFILSLEFTGYENGVRSKRLFWLFIIPIITILLVWTDKYHGFVRNNIHLDYSGIFPVIKKQYGPFFYIHAFHSHILNLATLFVLFRAVFIRKTLYRKQAAMLLLGVSLIVIPNLLYISGFSPVKGYDITPVFFSPSGIIMAWSILRYRMFDLVPLARAALIENMEAGVMVLDLQDRILDINPYFANMAGFHIDHMTSKHISEIGGYIPQLMNAILDRKVTRTEFSLNRDSKQIVYEALFSILKDKKGIDIGSLVVVYDITEKKAIEEECYKEQWKRAVKDERKRMVNDLHDNLGQVLGFINLHAQALQKELADVGEELYSEKLDKLIEVAQTAHQQIREYIHDVRNSELIELDFIAALDKEISNYELQTAIKVAKKITPEFSVVAISPDICIHILNIIKEAMNNVRKHAHASNVMVICDCVDNDIVVLVKDDGKGFTRVYDEDVPKYCFGLNIMRERTLEMRGKIEIESIPGEGSSIVLRVPIDTRGD